MKRVREVSNSDGDNIHIKCNKRIKTRTSSGQSSSEYKEKESMLQDMANKPELHNARPYQIEILEKAKLENTVVCLGTGTGKTFISSMLIKDKQSEIKGKLNEGGKRIFFVVNTVPLAEQQHYAIKQHTKLKVKFFTGDMGVDFWDKERWETEFNENDVLVLTAQILVNILTCGFISISNINLLILDECHNATKKHPYVRIMERFVDAQDRNLELPHVMGLTASIINEKYKKAATDYTSIKYYLSKKMKDLECTLWSKCVTNTDPEATASYATKPVEVILPYQVGYDVNDYKEVDEMIKSVKEALNESAVYFELKKQKYTKEHKSKGTELENPGSSTSHAAQYKAVINRTSLLGFKDGCTIAVDAIKYCSHILETLGPLCAYEAACILKEQLEKHKRRFTSNNRAVIEQCGEKLKEFIESFELCVAAGPFRSVGNLLPIEPFITKKAHTFLTDVLRQEKLEFQMKFRTDLHAIIFVQRRCTAVILNKLINLAATVDPAYEGLSSNYVLGHGLDENIRLADSFMRSSQQSTILREFKQSKFNVLVSTSVVEEGLDVRRCNLVVRFDGMSNYREYAQSKGRARAKHSKFIVMTEEAKQTEMTKQLEVMQNIEKVLFESCQNRQTPTAEESERQLYDEITELIPTIVSKDGNARIPHHCSIGLLHRFCSNLPHDKYTQIHPRFKYSKRGVEDSIECQAECRLPHNFPIKTRIWKGDWMRAVGDNSAEELAKKQLATLLCQKLLDIGELTEENLLPVEKNTNASSDEDFVDGEVKTIEGTRKNRSFYERKVPDTLSRNAQLKDCDLYAISIDYTEPYDKPSAKATWPLWYGDVKEGFGVFLPKGMDETVLPSFKLYTKNGAFSVNFLKLSNDNNDRSYDAKIKFYHAFICQEFFKTYVYGGLRFDVNGESIGLNKGYLVPLKPCVFYDIQRDRRPTSKAPVDYEQIEEILRLASANQLPDISDRPQPVIRKTYLDAINNKKLYYVIGSSDNKASDVMEGTKTFVDYYHKKYSKEIKPNVHLLNSIHQGSIVASFAENLDWKENVKEGPARIEELPPELCEVASILSAQHHIQIHMLPFVFYKLECLLNAKTLNKKIARTLELRITDESTMDFEEGEIEEGEEYEEHSTMIELKKMQDLLRSHQNSGFASPTFFEIFEATTTRQSSFAVDLERLEMLGDAFLKIAISVYLFLKHPGLDEGKLTRTRKDCVSNKNLCSVARELDLQHYINNTNFGTTHRDSENKNPVTVWLPPNHRRKLPDLTEPSEDFDSHVNGEIQWKPFQEVQDKSLADCIEALIGVYFKTGGVNLALHFMSNALNIPCMFKDINKPESSNVRLGTQSTYGDFPQPASAVCNEEATDEDVKYLYDTGLMSRLEEELGYVFQDKSHVVRALTHPSYDDNQVTSAYQEYEYLGDAILDFMVTLHVYSIKKKLSPGDLTSIKSSLVNNNVFSFYTVKLGLHKFMLHMSNDFFHDCAEFASMVEEGTEGESEMEDLFESPFIVVPPGSEEGFLAPKVMGDLVESLAGAIFLDSGMDLIKVWEVFYPIMQPIISKYIKNVPLSPKRQLHEAYSNVRFEFPSMEVENNSSNNDSIKCIVHYGNNNTEVGFGKSKKIAKIMACYRALKKEKKI